MNGKEVPMKIANQLPNNENKPRTARNWAVHGYLLNADAVGEEMYTNRNLKKAMY